MESNQLNSAPNEDAVIEALTLVRRTFDNGRIAYFNNKNEVHRIHGPAIIYPSGNQYWFKNSKRHREDGPAYIHANGYEEYWINHEQLSKEKFIQWQIENGIEPIE